MIVKIFCLALLFLAFVTSARSSPSIDHSIRKINVFGVNDVKISETVVTFHDESLSSLESSQMHQLLEVVKQQDFRVADVVSLFAGGTKGKNGSSKEGGPEGHTEGVEDKEQDNNTDRQENTAGDDDNSDGKENSDADYDNAGDHDGGDEGDNPDNEEDTNVDQDNDEELDEDDEDDNGDDGDDFGNERRRRPTGKKRRPGPKNRSNFGVGQGSQRNTGTKQNPQTSRSNENSQTSRTNENSQASRTNKNSQTSRNKQNSGNSESKDRTMKSQKPSSQKRPSKMSTPKRRRIGSKKIKGIRPGRRMPGFPKQVMRKLTEEMAKQYPKNNLRDPKVGNRIPEPSMPYNGQEGKKAGFGEQPGTIDSGGGGFPDSLPSGGSTSDVIGGIMSIGGSGLAAAGAGALGAGVGVAVGAGVGGGLAIGTVGALAGSGGGGGLAGREGGGGAARDANVEEKNSDRRKTEPTANGEHNLDVSDPKNLEPKQRGKAASKNLNPERRPNQNDEDNLDISDPEDPEPKQQQGNDDSKNLNPEERFNENGEDNLDVLDPNNPEPTQESETSPDNLNPEELPSQNGEDNLDVPDPNNLEPTQESETGPENLNPEDLPNQRGGNGGVDVNLNYEDSDKQNPDLISGDFTPSDIAKTIQKTNSQEQLSTVIAETDIALEKELFKLVHRGDYLNFTRNDFFGSTLHVHDPGQKCIRKTTDADKLDYNPATPVPGRNHYCEPEYAFRTSFSIPRRCCGPKYACPTHVKYTGPGGGVDTAKNLVLQRDCYCDLEFYKCLEENRDPSKMHPFFMFLYDTCLIKKTDVSKKHFIGYRVIGTADFIAFPMYN